MKKVTPRYLFSLAILGVLLIYLTFFNYYNSSYYIPQNFSNLYAYFVPILIAIVSYTTKVVYQSFLLFKPRLDQSKRTLYSVLLSVVMLYVVTAINLRVMKTHLKTKGIIVVAQVYEHVQKKNTSYYLFSFEDSQSKKYGRIGKSSNCFKKVTVGSNVSVLQSKVNLRCYLLQNCVEG